MFISVDLEWFLHSSSPRYQSNMRMRGRKTYRQSKNHSIHLQGSQSLLLLLETIINKAPRLSSYSCIIYLSDYIYFLIIKLHLFIYVWGEWGEQTQLKGVSSILPYEPQTHGSGHQPRAAAGPLGAISPALLEAFAVFHVFLSWFLGQGLICSLGWHKTSRFGM